MDVDTVMNPGQVGGIRDTSDPRGKAICELAYAAGKQAYTMGCKQQCFGELVNTTLQTLGERFEENDPFGHGEFVQLVQGCMYDGWYEEQRRVEGAAGDKPGNSAILIGGVAAVIGLGLGALIWRD